MVAKKQARKPRRSPGEIQRDNETRLRRMSAWMKRARGFCLTDANGPALVEPPRAEDGLAIGIHAQFVFWWIAFEAGYAQEGAQGEASGSRRDMNVFIRRAMRRGIREESWSGALDKLKESAAALIDLPPASQRYWCRGRMSPAAWEEEFRGETEKVRNELKRAAAGHHGSVPDVLKFLMGKRLYVVRNQIFHGGSSLDGSYGRPQVELGAELLSALVPKFHRTISCHREVDWGPVPYPRQEPAEKWPVKIPQRRP